MLRCLGPAPSSNLGGWLARTLGQRLPVSRVDAAVQSMRRDAFGPHVSMFAKGARGAREALLHLEHGGSLDLLVDQKMNGGIPVAFFGRPAMTAPASVRLAAHRSRPHRAGCWWTLRTRAATFVLRSGKTPCLPRQQIGLTWPCASTGVDEPSAVGRVPIPRPSYLDACQYLGFVHGRRRWRSHDGQRLYEWDELHGEIEVYNRRGKHLGVLDPDGNTISDAVPGRTIDV